MILIIAEKPSLGRNIVQSIGQMTKHNGYYEGLGYIVTWAFGHLFSLCDIEDYTGEDKQTTRWNIASLPCFPDKFRYVLRSSDRNGGDKGVETQFNIIRSLCLREDVDTIVNAGDADREGEIIVRLCIEKSGVSGKKLMRLWLPDQTPETIASSLSSMKEEKEYDNLADEGFARTYIDWLYGVNLTRYATLKAGSLLRVGRVIVPIVRAIYDRDMAIKNFVPDIYYAIRSCEITKGEPIELVSKKRFDKNDLRSAEALCLEYNKAGAVVTAVKNKKEVINPGKLYSLSKLQNFLSKKYKMSMSESLDIVQKLYERGFLSYPRTDSEYLATTEKDKVKKILSTIERIGYPVTFKDSKTIFDDSKIESHSAIIPTYKIPDKQALSDKEMIVYQAVFRRFVAVFCKEECVAKKTEITIDVIGHEQFVLRGIIILEKGFLRFDDSMGSKNDKILPPLEKGDAVNIDFKPVEKQTTPPKHHTVETLNNYLKNPFREEKAMSREEAEESGLLSMLSDPTDDSEDYKAIFEGFELGTEATRTGIIDNARKSGYIELKKDVYTILPGGIFLIEQISLMGISMDKYKTSLLGRALKKVYHGTITISDSVKLAEDEIREVFAVKEGTPETDTDTGFFGDVIGVCPICGKDVLRGRKSYYCSGYKDGCTLNINTSICSRSISKQNAVLLLTNGKTAKIEGFISRKTGKPFSAFLKLENGKAVFDFSN